MILQLEYQMTLSFSAPVRQHQYLLRLLPRHDGGQLLLSVELSLPAGSRQQDGFGNQLTSGLLAEAHDQFRVVLSARVRQGMSMAAQDVLPVGVFLPQSGLTQTADTLLADFVHGCALPAGARARAIALSRWVYGQLKYQPGSSHVAHRVADTLARGAGVCQDYAQLLLALLRREGIAARYVAGFMRGEGQSHAWVEAWVEGGWLGLDPTHDRLVTGAAPYVRVAVGRDFNDCPLNTGVFVGQATQELLVQAWVQEESGC